MVFIKNFLLIVKYFPFVILQFLLVQSLSFKTFAQIELFKDINPGEESSFPAFSAKTESLAFFIANYPGAGYELWITDGTQDGTRMVKDIKPGEESSSTRFFIPIGNGVVFTADDGIYGEEPWYSDGTENGTYLLADLNLGQNSSIPYHLIKFKDHVYFQALNVSNLGNSGVELHRTENLPPANASMFLDLHPGNGSALFYPGTPLEVAGDYLYFRGRNGNGTTGDELWITDGTVNDTRLVADIYPGPLSSLPQNLTAFGNLLFFIANDSISGYEPWITDGTEEGTVQLKDINPGVNDGATLLKPINFKGQLLFIANDGSTGNELWMTDGTPEGTQLLKDIYPGSTSGFNFVGLRGIEYKDKFYFAANGQKGIELWVTDGTDAGTMMFMDLNPDSGYTFITDFFIYNDKLFFVSESIWATDGTAAGTHKVFDLTNISISPLPGQFFEINNEIFFQARDSAAGAELWRLVPPNAGAIISVSEDGKVIIGENTGIAITFSGINSSIQKINNDTISFIVERYNNGLTSVSGINENFFSSFHWILYSNDSINIDPSSSIHFLLSEFDNIEIPNPSNIQVYFRETPGAGSFSPLNTIYDEINNEIVATGFEKFGQFIFGSDEELILPVNDEINFPQHFKLEQNYPNPFNPVTTIKFSIPAVESHLPAGRQGSNASLQISLKVYDILGREVATLVNEEKTAGNYEIKFDAGDLPDGRQALSSGIYFYQLSAGNYKDTKKLMLLK